MKNLLLLFIALSPLFSIAQAGKYGDLQKGNYDEYITKNGDTLIKGDKLIIGTPVAADAFMYITQGNEKVHIRLSGKEVEIHKFKAWTLNKKEEPSMYVLFKGYGLIPVYIDYENALKFGEIINPSAKFSKDDAIAELEEAKKLLDLGVITQEDYDKMKNKLSKVILEK